VIVDSSALVAIAIDEPEARVFAQLVEGAATVRISAGTLLESSIVLGPIGQKFLDGWVSSSGCEVVPFDEEQSSVARRAYLTYGKGSGSRARLNFGDCFTYALAKVTGEPLLFTGDDFTHTDVTPAFTPG